MRKHYPFRVRPVRRLAYGMTLGLTADTFSSTGPMSIWTDRSASN